MRVDSCVPRRGFSRRWALPIGVLLLLLLLSACTPVPTAAVPTFPPEITATPTLLPSPAPAATAVNPADFFTKTAAPASATPASKNATALPPTAAPARPTATLAPLALPTRIPARDWKQWPVVPAITNRARQIYLQGLGHNDPRAFSKVGDCQGIKEVWLGVYDQPGLYHLSADNAALQDTINWFSGSFNRDGFAVMGGYNARAVLQPGVADPAFCQAGESPIACEYRVHHPSIVLVSLEFYYDGRTAKNYEQYMRQVLDFYIARGVVPVLATKADNMEGDESLNLVTANLAVEYDLPLWNFWKAAQALPNHGMDTTRPDGFHISVDAWRERSATSLQALDSVWRGLRDLLPASAAGAATKTPVTTRTAAPTPGTATAQPASTQLVLGLAERTANGPRSKGVYLLNIKAETLVQLLDDRYQLQDVSPDGARMLVNQGPNLYLASVDGTGLKQVASDFYPYSARGAAWLPDGRSFLMIANRSTSLQGGSQRERGLWQVAADGGAAQRLTPPEVAPFELAPDPKPQEIFWADGGCALDPAGAVLPAECTAGSWYRSAADGSAPFSLVQIFSPLRSGDGAFLAYTYLSEKSKPVLAISADAAHGGGIWTPLPEGYLLDKAWSPSGRWLAALWQERSDYSGKVTAQKLYLLSPSDNQLSSVLLTINQDGQASWSPDGRWILVTGVESVAEGYHLDLRLVPTNGGGVNVLDGKISPSGLSFVYVTNLTWLPGK
jgi:hypothetical protein